jgi:DNA-directed RNA polymerase III subunit RPC8
VLIEQIETKYLNKIILHAGLGVAFYDFISIGDPYLYPGEGACVQLVKFRLCVFRPFIGEVLSAKIVSSNKDGLKLTMGFFDDITIASSVLQHPCEYIASSGQWKWVYEGNDLLMRVGDEVRFKVRTINFTGIIPSSKGITATTTVESQAQTLSRSSESANVSNVNKSVDAGATAPMVRRRSSSMDVSAEELPVPMHIVGAMNDFGLGCVSWW